MKNIFNAKSQEYHWLRESLAKGVHGFDDSLSSVIGIMHELQLPVPTHPYEFINAAQGLITMTSRYGIVLRIEYSWKDRVNESPWVLQPIDSFKADDFIVEICGGTNNSNDKQYNDLLLRELKKANVDFKDHWTTTNVGLLPAKTLTFPHGIPVVIDRTALARLGKNTYGLKAALKDMGVTKDPQAELYDPLRRSLREAWPDRRKKADPVKMMAFWGLCEEFTKQGKLVAGWDTEREDKYKLIEARTSAQNYDLLMKEVNLPSSQYRL